MKNFFFVLLALTVMSCASHENRKPSSVDMENVERGVNTDYYGNGLR